MFVYVNEFANERRNERNLVLCVFVLSEQAEDCVCMWDGDGSALHDKYTFAAFELCVVYCFGCRVMIAAEVLIFWN